MINRDALIKINDNIVLRADEALITVRLNGEPLSERLSLQGALLYTIAFLN